MRQRSYKMYAAIGVGLGVVSHLARAGAPADAFSFGQLSGSVMGCALMGVLVCWAANRLLPRRRGR